MKHVRTITSPASADAIADWQWLIGMIGGFFLDLFFFDKDEEPEGQG